jgi:hypothetical protein
MSLCTHRVEPLCHNAHLISRYDTEAECEALEKEKTALEARLAIRERKYVHAMTSSFISNSLFRLSETTEKNAFLSTRSNLKALGLSDESEWKVCSCLRFEVCLSDANVKNTGAIEIGREPEKAIRRKSVAIAI